MQITRCGRERKLLGTVFLILGIVFDVQNNELETQISGLMQSGTTILSTNFPLGSLGIHVMIVVGLEHIWHHPKNAILVKL